MVQKKIKKIISRILSTKPNRLYKTLEKYQWVSFDVFDTLIKRDTIVPEQVFFLVEVIAKQRGLFQENFTLLRKQAEEKARRKSNTGEVSLLEIYASFDGLIPLQKQELYKLEVQTELDICQANHAMKPIYEWCLQHGKKILLISDMYLPHDVISAILKKNGYTDYKRLFVSCEYQVSKNNGLLFSKAIEELSIAGNQIIHIGDSLKADFLIPKRQGFSSKLIFNCLSYEGYLRKRKNAQWPKNDLQSYDILRAFISNRVSKQDDAFERIGYEILGPLLVGFCQWLQEKLQQIDIDHIYFLARDGKILQSAFLELYPEWNPKVHYLYISRKAAIKSVLDKFETYDEINQVLISFSNATIADLLDCYALPIHLRKSFLTAISVKETDRLKDIAADQQKMLINTFQDIIREYANIQRFALNEYLNEKQFWGNIALVDIGWAGRIQWCLQKAVENRVGLKTINGFYLGIIHPDHAEKGLLNLSRTAFLGEMTKSSLMAREILETAGVFEMMFLNEEGSTCEYAIVNGEAKPIFDSQEQSEEMLKNIRRLQDSALRFVKDIKGSWSIRHGLTWSPQMVFCGYENFAVHPRTKELELYKEAKFKNGEVQAVLAEHTLLFYCLHPRKFLKDMEQSTNRVFFLKSLFKIPFPYFHFLMKLSNIMRQAKRKGK